MYIVLFPTVWFTYWNSSMVFGKKIFQFQKNISTELVLLWNFCFLEFHQKYLFCCLLIGADRNFLFPFLDYWNIFFPNTIEEFQYVNHTVGKRTIDMKLCLKTVPVKCYSILPFSITCVGVRMYPHCFTINRHVAHSGFDSKIICF
jgi:hypothetical protein